MFGKYSLNDYKSLMEQRDMSVLNNMGGVDSILSELKTSQDKGT